MSDGDELQPAGMDGVNVVLNRVRLAEYLARFGEDKDIRDLLMLDVLAQAAGLPLTSTGLVEKRSSLVLRPFRLWEYSWIYKTLRLSQGRATVLDLGGPATHLSVLAAMAGCSVTSLDVNPEFVEVAKECADALHLPNLVSRVGDMRDLSQFAPESFDIVISCSVLEHLTARDQETALAQVARVVRPGGLVGLTFDYGPEAPGANIYLPPPHQPPATAAEALRRYARDGLVVAGNPFAEDAVPGSLFHDDVVRYTVASLFLAKPPVRAMRPPQPESCGSVLGRLMVSMLPSRLWERARAPLQDSDAGAAIADRDAQIVELGKQADERLAALRSMDAQFVELRREATERERGLHELTGIIAERDARILELERMAEERLSALHSLDAMFAALKHEADKRECGLHELSAIIAQRDVRLAELEGVAEERLSALHTLEASLAEVRRQADECERELLDAVAQRDLRISELTHESDQYIAKQALMAKRVVDLEAETLVRYAIRRIRKMRQG